MPNNQDKMQMSTKNKKTMKKSRQSVNEYNKPSLDNSR